VEKKGVIHGVRAFAISFKKHKNIKMTIAGNGPLFDQIKNEIERLKMTEHIKMLGYVPDLLPEMQKAHIFISPSVVAKSGDAEGGINVTVIEALATGLPVITTRQAQSDLVFDDQTGYVVNEGDEKALSDKMNALIEDPALIMEFGKNGREMAEKLDSSRQVAILESHYERLIEQYGTTSIAYMMGTYLPYSETFIYEPLRLIKDHRMIVVSERTKHRDDFPHKWIYSMSSLPRSLQIAEKIANLFGKFWFFKRVLIKENVKLIHAHFATEGILLLPLKRKLDLPMVTSFYGLDVYKFIKDPFFMMRLRKLFRDGDLFLTFSEKMRQHVISLGCPSKKVRTHHGGADFSKFPYKQREASGKINILLVGRFVEKKGIAYAIKSMPLILAEAPNTVLSVIGDGPLRQEFEGLIKDLKLENNINLLGAKAHKEYIDELYSSHIMISPSVSTKSGDDEGGINTTVIEAMASGMPVIATEHSGSELVFDAKTGYTVPEKNPEELAKTVVFLIKNRSSWSSITKEARSLIEDQFDIVEQTRKLEMIYGELISGYTK
jgi:colanic acid/amylovoran biosynthesis glycosyltransferase